MVGESQSARSGDHGMNGDIAQLRRGIAQQPAQSILYIRIMPDVIGEDESSFGIQYGYLDCG